MAFIRGDRQQIVLFPSAVEDYIPPTDPVRAYDAFIDHLDLNELGFNLDENKIGPPEFDPSAMLKLLVYGYSYGLRSSRKLERATHHNVSFIWLLGNLKPDYKTIARFRRHHRNAIAQVLKQSVRLCLKLGLVEGNTLFVDGTKIKANASMDHSWNEDRAQKLLKETDQRIEQILSDIEILDQQEENQESLVQMKKDLADKHKLKIRVQDILTQLKHAERPDMNTTDPECAKVKDKQEFISGYNLQAVVDDQHGLIVHAEVVTEANDSRQFADQINQANNNIGGTCKTACADAGYANSSSLKNISDQNIRVVVPSQRQALKEPAGPFSKDKFIYEAEHDRYRCPAGEFLNYVCNDGYARKYRASAHICRACPSFNECTANPKGRIISRLILEAEKEKFERQYKQGRHIFQRRKEKAELPFGHIKHNLGARAFLLRGLRGVKAEASILATCFNLTRIISILGVQRLIQQLNAT